LSSDKRDFGGVTPTEKLLASLCQRTFLRLWSYSNVFNADGKEFCDLLAVFGQHVFIFFDRESRKFDEKADDLDLTWQRWKRETVDKQVKTALGAERYLRKGGALFSDNRLANSLPVKIPENAHIHKIIVAHGAAEACKKHSPRNIYGSLAVSYSDSAKKTSFPFMVDLSRHEKIHLFDSFNLELVFSVLDTFFDFSTYIVEKERALSKYDLLSYCGEEDLLAHYLINYDEKSNRYRIGTDDPNLNGVLIGEGEWHDFASSEAFRRRIDANKVSYFWDDLIQRTCDNFIEGTSGGNSDLYGGKSAIVEMACEPRFSRRALAKNMLEKSAAFPASQGNGGLMRHMSTMPSFFKDRMYVFLQVEVKRDVDYERGYRVVRRRLLEIACGATKNKFPHLKKIIGIAVEPPKFNRTVSEDVLLLECDDWPEDRKKYYEEENKLIGFYEGQSLKHSFTKNSDFPPPPNISQAPIRVGRNDKCPCGSGKKYKKCCLLLKR
jgi:hypothetical protein